jgi:hypothetical protein
MLFSLIILVFFVPTANSFIFDKTSAPVPLTDLGHLVEAQTDQRLSVGLDIGKPGESRLAINGLVFDLTKRSPSFNDDFVKMPGVHGLKPSLSGGLNTLTTVQDGSYISMSGSEFVKPSKGSWEIIWSNGSPSGSILCGFEIDQDYKRNDAVLPKGTVYVSFNTWTSEGLKHAQGIKERSTKKANTALMKKDDELAKMKETNNVLHKAFHYYNALNAAEAYSKLPNSKMKVVPSSEEVVHFGGDMYVSTKGLVWTQKLPTGKPTIFGNAHMKSVSKRE